jgi:hypothetical protein
MATEIKTISRISRINSSVNGNPRYEVGFDDATTAISSSDHGWCYTVGNPGMKVGDTVSVTYTKAGRIENMESANKTPASELREIERVRKAQKVGVLVPNRGGKLHISGMRGEGHTMCGRTLDVRSEDYRTGTRSVSEIHGDIDSCRTCLCSL